MLLLCHKVGLNSAYFIINEHFHDFLLKNVRASMEQSMPLITNSQLIIHGHGADALCVSFS